MFNLFIHREKMPRLWVKYRLGLEFIPGGRKCQRNMSKQGKILWYQNLNTNPPPPPPHLAFRNTVRIGQFTKYNWLRQNAPCLHHAISSVLSWSLEWMDKFPPPWIILLAKITSNSLFYFSGLKKSGRIKLNFHELQILFIDGILERADFFRLHPKWKEWNQISDVEERPIRGWGPWIGWRIDVTQIYNFLHPHQQSTAGITWKTNECLNTHKKLLEHRNSHIRTW